MKAYNDVVKLGNGLEMPIMGFGTYAHGEWDSLSVIRKAIEAGFRYFDTASLYGTEKNLGIAIKESGISREEFFIATKAWYDELGYDNIKHAFAESMKRLQMDYVEIYYIHWPRNPQEENWKQVLTESYRALEELYKEGKIKGIGVSNFLPNHIDHIFSIANVAPVVDQLEIHPGYSQERAVAYCKEKGLQPVAWSSVGRRRTFEDERIKGFAEKYGRSIPQICLRFALQKGIVPLVKTSTLERMYENQNVFDFEISDEDIKMLECMEQNLGSGEHPDFAIPVKKVGENYK